MNPEEYEYADVDEHGYPVPTWYDVQLLIAHLERMLKVDAEEKYQAAQIAKMDRLREAVLTATPPSRWLRFRFWIDDNIDLLKIWWV